MTVIYALLILILLSPSARHAVHKWHIRPLRRPSIGQTRKSPQTRISACGHNRMSFSMGSHPLRFRSDEMGTIHPHILATTIGALGYLAQLSKNDGQLANLRQEISCCGLDRCQLTTRDYLEAVGNGTTMGLLVCGMVEAVNLAIGVHKVSIIAQDSSLFLSFWDRIHGLYAVIE